MKKIFWIICIIIIILVIASSIFIYNMNSKNNEIVNKLQIGKASNMINENELSDLEKILQDAEVDNLEVFVSWIKEYNQEPFINCGIAKEWTELNSIKYNETALLDRWEKNHDKIDSDCRMTAFLLMNNHINMNKTINENGSYLMFDIDAIDNNNNYKILKEKRDKFITLFNEIDVSELSKEEIKNSFNKKWNDYGITVNNDKISLIFVIMHDNYSNVVYVGHVGVFIDLGEKKLFIEKIAFEQPYQVTVFSNREELKNMLFSRENYFGDKTEEGPFIYENEKLLFSYK